MFCTVTDSKIKACRPHETVPPQYPSEYFNKIKDKPTLRIPQSKLSLKNARELVKGGLARGELSVKHAMRYVYLVLDQIEEESDGDWTTFGINIAKKGTTVKVFSMFNIVEEEDKTVEGTQDTKVSGDDDKWLVLAVLSMYRLGRMTNTAHKNVILTKLNNQIKGLNQDATPIVDMPGMQLSWLTNSDFCKMVAGIDMFFNKFKNNEWAFLRFGTIPSRFKDCSALLSLGHICEVTGMQLEDFLDWVFVGSVAREIVGMMKEGNEIDDAYSYMPYMMELGLSLKSPYSSTACPGTYTLVHLVGALLFSERSKNARMISENNISNIKMNAEIMAYVKGKKGSLVKAFVKEEDRERIQDKDDDSSECSDGSDEEYGEMPKTNDPYEWFAFLEFNNFDLPEEIKDHIKIEARKITGSRAGTIGHHINSTY